MVELWEIVVRFPYPGLFCLLMLGSIGLPFPEDAVLLFCGFLISSHIVLPLPALLVVYAGVIVSDLFIYTLRKKYGRAVITHRRFRRLLSAEKLAFLEDAYRRYGVLAIVIGRQIIGVRAHTILAAGILGMSVRRFLITDAFSSLVTVIITVSLGYAGTQTLLSHRPPDANAAYLLILLFSLAVCFYVMMRRRSKRRARPFSIDKAAFEETSV